MRHPITIATMLAVLLTAGACHGHRGAHDADASTAVASNDCVVLAVYEVEGEFSTVTRNTCTGEQTVDDGMVVATHDGLVRLEVTDHDDAVVGPGGVLTRRWQDVVAVDATGERTTVLSGEPADNEAPTHVAGMERQLWSVTHEVRITAIVGTSFSYHESVWVDLGGVHPMDESRYGTMGFDGVDIHPLEWVGEPTYQRLESSLASEAQRRRELGEVWMPEMPPFSELAHSAWHWNADGSLQLTTYVQCCSWAENHNLLEVSVASELPDGVTTPPAEALGKDHLLGVTRPHTQTHGETP